MESKIILPPEVVAYYDRLLLNKRPLPYSEKLKEIGEWLLTRIESNEFKKFLNTKANFKKKYQKFLELYERITKEEEENKTKKNKEVIPAFYRPNFADTCCRNVFERLKKRVAQSSLDRRNNAFS